MFIGHGAPSTDGDDGVLVGMDARASADSLASRGVARTQLLDELEAGGQAESIVVLDACFSGRAQGGEALVEGAQPVIPVVEPKVGSGVTVMSAAKSDEVAGALPGEKRPAFSYFGCALTDAGTVTCWGDNGSGQADPPAGVRPDWR